MKHLAAPTLVLALGLASLAPASAVTFDERWKSLFGVSEVITEAVSAKAEYVRTKKAERPARHARRSSVRRGRMVRHREWYKGGRKWHYVYKRRRG